MESHSDGKIIDRAPFSDPGLDEGQGGDYRRIVGLSGVAAGADGDATRWDQDAASIGLAVMAVKQIDGSFGKTLGVGHHGRY